MIEKETLVQRLEREVKQQEDALAMLVNGATVQQDYGKGLVDDPAETERRKQAGSVEIANLKAQLEKAKANDA